jgi:hypothetical protein
MGLLEDEYDDCGSQRSDEKLTFVISLSVKKTPPLPEPKLVELLPVLRKRSRSKCSNWVTNMIRSLLVDC